MNIVGRHLEERGFEFLAVNSDPEKNPQFVCLKEKQMHFVVVRPVPLGMEPARYDHILMNKVYSHAEKFEAKAYFAGVGLEHPDGPDRPLIRHQPYLLEFSGLYEWNP